MTATTVAPARSSVSAARYPILTRAPVHERHPTVQRCGLEALGVVEVTALRAERVVERVQSRVGRLAHVAGARLLQLRAIAPLRDVDQTRWRLEDLRLASRADPGGFAQRPIVPLSRLTGRSAKGLLELPLLCRLGVDHATRRDQQRLAFLEWQQRQQRAILHDWPSSVARARRISSASGRAPTGASSIVVFSIAI